MNNNYEISIENNTHNRIMYKKDMENIVNEFITFFEIKQTILIEVVFEYAEVIHELNRVHRGIDRTTDVLSFGLDAIDFYKDQPILPLGEIYINYDKVREQAKNFGHSVRREFCYLFLHSLLHLYGYDHVEDEAAKEMNKIASHIMDKVGIRRN